MNLLDTIVLVMMVFFILKGILRGFLREVFSLAGVVLGIWAGIFYQDEVSGYLKTYLPDTDYLGLVGFLAVFTLSVVLCNFLGMVAKFVVYRGKGGISRTLGGGVAFIKGVVVIYLIMVMLTFFLPSKTPLVAESKLAPWIVVSYQSMVKMISGTKAEKWKKEALKRKEQLEESLGSRK